MTEPQNPTTQLGNPKAELLRRFEHDMALHSPQSPGVGELLDEIRAHYTELGRTMIDLLPLGRDLSMALTDLETSQRCALAAVVKNQEAVLPFPDSAT